MSQISEMKSRTDPFNHILSGTKTIEYLNETLFVS